ncbi:hypothetical protein [Dehalogenimonas etheniformans]|uniref:DUF3887 domain-containing protein n=1 Tax=Dehalogenimonas etheniformans TaxID=1536648 RepID=A0A2P5P836_9CHLR|nr:hypothetical protein [Dehalogenimonas etheniformans]PPD58446.1 hypothetical protein JP09_004180 [Dehalogenimonas etheniformans]QNT75870.1 hypothetical protein HX448_03795 [Dehalogenimonas etheniformans]
MKPLKWLLVVPCVMILTVGCTSNSNYQAVLTKNTTLEQQVGDLTTQLNTLQGKYDQITKVYPPHEFASLKALGDWLLLDKTSDLSPADSMEALYSKALGQQAAALKDGYVISVDQEVINDQLYFVFCTTVIGGQVWVWDIETDDPYQPIGFGTVTIGL